MTPQQARDIVRKRCAADPAYHKRIAAEWAERGAEIEQEYARRRPKPLVYEVHHRLEKERDAFFLKLAIGA